MLKFNTPNFSDEMKRIAAKSFEDASVVVRQVGLQGLTNLTLESPVDTGRLRANWQVSIDAPKQGTLFADDVAEAAGGKNRTAARILRAAIKAGTQTASLPFRVGVNKSIWLVNNLPYVQRVNEGHSTKNTPGWVERAMQDAVSAIKQLRG